jgi:phospho-N-acetylmuramoyl-pentapeptide-transferase
MNPLLDLSVNDHVRNLLLLAGVGGISFLLFLAGTPALTKFLLANRLQKRIRKSAAGGGGAPIFHLLHAKKEGTPTMAGLLLWLVVGGIVAAGWLFFLARPDLFPEDFFQRVRGQLFVPLGTMALMALLGAVDDFWNIIGSQRKRKEVGLGVSPQLLFLFLFAGLAAWWFSAKLGWTTVHIPGVGDLVLGGWAALVYLCVIVGTAKAVDITDGLDGLAAGLLIPAFAAFALIAYAKGLLLLCLLLATVGGGLLGFLWFNLPPARFFLGTVGILPLGALLAIVAILTNSIVALFLIGFLFFAEFASSLLQFSWKKFFGRKLLPVAPLHHTFQKLGWSEELVVMRFWIVGAGCALAGAVLGMLGMGVVV